MTFTRMAAFISHLAEKYPLNDIRELAQWSAIVECFSFAWRMSGELWVCVKPAIELRTGYQP